MERRTLGHLHKVGCYCARLLYTLYQPSAARSRRDHLNIHNILWLYGFVAAAQLSTATTNVGVCELVILRLENCTFSV